MRPASIKDRSPLSPSYQRHRPERTLLYQIIGRHYPEFRDVMAMQGKSLPQHVQQEFTDYCIEDQVVIDKILHHLMKKGVLPPPPELLPATRASLGSDWFA